VKSIPLKTLDASDGPPIVYAEILREVVRRPLNPREGIQIEEMRKSIKLLDAIDSANGTLDLEDADYGYLKQKIEAMNWNIVDRRIIQLVDDVTSA